MSTHLKIKSSTASKNQTLSPSVEASVKWLKFPRTKAKKISTTQNS